MDSFLQAFGDITGHGPHQISDAVPSGPESVQPFSQPVMPLNDKGQIQSTTNNGTGNSQPWQRTRWTDDMVKLLINTACYFGPEQETGRSSAPRKGKWRSISNAMAEAGHVLSPQQCEDKFNDLNKKYKKLQNLLGGLVRNDSLGNPGVIESVNIPEEAKKILSCKQLFYREMCLYHDKNRKERLKHGSGSQSVCAKKQKHGDYDNNNTHLPVEGFYDLINADKKLRIQDEMLGLEKEKFEWRESCKKEEEELDQMRLENEVMRLENKRLAFELKCRERSQWGPFDKTAQ